MTSTRIAQYYATLRKRKVGFLIALIAVAVLGGVFGFARSSKPAQAAPPVLEVGGPGRTEKRADLQRVDRNHRRYGQRRVEGASHRLLAQAILQRGFIC